MLGDEPNIVVDTVVVNYFLAVGGFERLRDLLGGAVYVPRAVFDPDAPEDTDEAAVSELRAGLRFHRRRASDARIPLVLRERSARVLPHFEKLDELAASSQLVALDLSEDELRLFAQLRDVEYVRQFARVGGLGRGEAAALAIALRRGTELATDDQDAIAVGRALNPELPVRRIRGLLLEAVERGLTSISEAEELHRAMIDAGFWDRGALT